MLSRFSADSGTTSAKSALAEISAMNGSSRSFGLARSTLLTSSRIGRPACLSSSSARWSSSVQRSASITNRLTSESASDDSAMRFM